MGRGREGKEERGEGRGASEGGEGRGGEGGVGWPPCEILNTPLQKYVTSLTTL